MLYFNKTAINQSISGNITSEILDISKAEGFCLHAVWSGTPTGTITLSASNSLDLSDFVSITSQSTGGTPGKFIYNVEKAHYCYILISYVHTSGSGFLKCFVSAKEPQ